MGANMEVTADFDGDSTTPDTTQSIWVPVFYDYDKYAGTGALAAILARPDEYRHLISLSGNYPLGKGLELKLSTTLGFYQNFGNTAGVAKVMILAYIGILYRIPTGAK